MITSQVTVAPCIMPVGPQLHTSQHQLERFSHFVDEELLSLIVWETNRYAAQCLSGTNATWETNISEIRAYLGFMVVMGINRLPELHDYWSQDPKLHNEFIAS